MALTEQTRADAVELAGRYPQSRSALLPLLHLVQSAEGTVTPDGIALCADVVGLTTAEVAAVATFYTMYKRHKVGRYHVGVCTNTLCAVLGGDAIWGALSERLGVGHDEVTADGFSHRVEKRVQPDLVGLRKIMQHIAVHQRLVARMPDAKPHAHEMRPAMGDHRADAVVARRPAAQLDADLARLEVVQQLRQLLLSAGEVLRAQRLLQRLRRLGRGDHVPTVAS